MLFSDIEGSTQLVRRLGDDWGPTLRLQRQICRTAWRAWGGHEMGTEGDSFFVVFADASAAAAAALSVQEAIGRADWPQNAEIRVRMGIHTGSPTRLDEGYVGMDVHLAARIAGAAHGGQVLTSEATCGQLGTIAMSEIRVDNLGRHRLKDIEELTCLFQISTPGLPDSFPPPRTVGAATRLPAFTAPLVGREEELEEIVELLSNPETRLVTLIATGGAGKTRLAVAAAAAVADEVHFVDCTEATAVDDVWPLIGLAVGAPASECTAESVLAQLAMRKLTLLLDNLEHLAGAGDLVSRLLTAAQQVRVLATSRAPLRAPGEQEYQVPPMATTGPGDPAGSPAVRLFAQYAALSRRGFTVSKENVDAIAKLCVALDGLPLAIELVAARTKLLSPDALLARIDKALDIAAGSGRPGRHQTVRQTIAWSYDLLKPDQQRGFAALAVLAPAADLAECAAVVNSDRDVFDLVAELADLSLVTIAETDNGEPVVGMLATLRAFALERLREPGEETRVRDAHAAEYADRAARRAELFARDQVVRPSTAFRLVDNAATALDWLLRPGNPHLPAQTDVVRRLMLLYLPLDWEVSAESGNHERVIRWVDSFLGSRVPLTPAEHAVARVAAAGGYFVLRQAEESNRHLDLAAADARTVGGDVLFAWLGARFSAALCDDDVLAARQWAEELDQLAQRSGSRNHKAFAGGLLADVVSMQDLHEEALALDLHNLDLYRQLGNTYRIMQTQHNVACSLRLLGRREEALATFRELVPAVLNSRLGVLAATLADDLGALLAEVARPDLAALLLGASDAFRDQTHAPRHPFHGEREIQESYALARADLGDEEYERWYQRGGAMTLASALEQVTAEL